jgi:hypothetical protein
MRAVAKPILLKSASSNDNKKSAVAIGKGPGAPHPLEDRTLVQLLIHALTGNVDSPGGSHVSGNQIHQRIAIVAA